MLPDDLIAAMREVMEDYGPFPSRILAGPQAFVAMARLAGSHPLLQTNLSGSSGVSFAGIPVYPDDEAEHDPGHITVEYARTDDAPMLIPVTLIATA